MEQTSQHVGVCWGADSWEPARCEEHRLRGDKTHPNRDRGRWWQRKISRFGAGDQAVPKGQQASTFKTRGRHGRGTGAVADTAKDARLVEPPTAAPRTGDRRARDAPAGRWGRPHRPGGRRQRGETRSPPRPGGPAPPRELHPGHPPPRTAEPSRGDAGITHLPWGRRSAPLRPRLRRRAREACGGAGAGPPDAPRSRSAPAPRRPPPQHAASPPAGAAPPGGRRGRRGAGAAAGPARRGGAETPAPAGRRRRSPRGSGSPGPSERRRRRCLEPGSPAALPAGSGGLRANKDNPDQHLAKRRKERSPLTPASPALVLRDLQVTETGFTVPDLHTMTAGKERGGKQAFLHALV